MLFKLPLGRHGELPAAAVRVPITGEMVYQPGTNANGITATPDGHALIVVQSNTGKIFRTAYSGRTTAIDLGGESVVNGDGLWLRGRTLYAVQNRDNVITKIALDRGAARGQVVSRTGDPAFDVPTHDRRLRQPVLPAQRPLHHAGHPHHAVRRGGGAQAVASGSPGARAGRCRPWSGAGWPG